MRFPLLFTLLAGVSLASSAAEPPKCPPPPSHIDVESGDYSSQPGVVFKLVGFRAEMDPVSKRAPFCYSKVAVVERGEVFASSETLQRVFSTKVKRSEVKELKVETLDGSVRLSGKKGHLAFTIEGPVSTDGNLLLLDARKIKADGIPVKALMGMLGKHLRSVIGDDTMQGVKVNGNTLAFDPQQLGHIRGRIEALSVTPQGLTLKYATAPPQKKLAASTGHAPAKKPAHKAGS